MSPWLHDELRILLGPRQLSLQAAAPRPGWRGLRRSAPPAQRIDVPDADGPAPDWRAALRALQAALPAPPRRRSVATVVLSNQFVRYAVVPWRADLADDEEELAWARHCFTRVHGKAAQSWEIRLSPEGAGRPRLACAADTALLADLRELFAQAQLPLRTIEPHLMAAFNRGRARLRPRNAWLALLEPDHLCLALLQDGRWARVRNQRLAQPWREALPRLLAREAFLGDAAALPQTVYLAQAGDEDDPALPSAAPWQFHALDPVAPQPATDAR